MTHTHTTTISLSVPPCAHFTLTVPPYPLYALVTSSCPLNPRNALHPHYNPLCSLDPFTVTMPESPSMAPPPSFTRPFTLNMPLHPYCTLYTPASELRGACLNIVMSKIWCSSTTIT